jgi:hypothetical protein
VHAAVAHTCAVPLQRQQPLEVAVVELRVASDQRVARQIPVRVVVLVPLLGLPSQQPPRGDTECESDL